MGDAWLTALLSALVFASLCFSIQFAFLFKFNARSGWSLQKDEAQCELKLIKVKQYKSELIILPLDKQTDPLDMRTEVDIVGEERVALTSAGEISYLLRRYVQEQLRHFFCVCQD